MLNKFGKGEGGYIPIPRLATPLVGNRGEHRVPDQYRVKSLTFIYPSLNTIRFINKLLLIFFYLHSNQHFNNGSKVLEIDIRVEIKASLRTQLFTWPLS